MASQAELVRSQGYTRSRASRILALLRLAPAIQECLLTLPPPDRRSPLTEHALQPLLRLTHAQQLAAFERFHSRASGLDPAA